MYENNIFSAGRAGRRRWAGGGGIMICFMFLHSRTRNTYVQAVPPAALCLALGVCNACGGIGAEFEAEGRVLRIFHYIFNRNARNVAESLICFEWDDCFEIVPYLSSKTILLGGSCG